MPSYTKVTSEITGNLVLAYGRHVVTGTIVQKVTSGFGDNAQTTIISLLGEGEWDSIEAIYWGGAAIDPANYHFHAGTSTQTADSWNVNGNAFLNTAYVIVRLPVGAVTADEEDFSKLKMICRCVKVQNYNANGTPTGVPVFSTNPALVAADLLIKQRGLPTTRIDWESWAAWRDFCDVVIPWTGGETAGRPTYQNSSNIIETDNGGLNKAYGVPANGWNGFISTTQSIPVGVDGYYEVDADKGSFIAGLSTLNSITAVPQINFALYFNVDGTLYLYRNPGDQSIAIGSWVAGDRLRVAVEGGVAKVYKNGQAIDISSYAVVVPNAPLYGAVAAYTQYSGTLRGSFRPMGSAARERKRFEAGLAFPNLTDLSAALDAVMYVSCSDYQDVDGKFVFVPPSMAGAERTPTYNFNMGNIVADSFETYRLTASQRPTKLAGKFRNADDQYLKEDSVTVNRTSLETILGRPNEGREVFLGTVTKGQADCVMNYQMRLTSDLDLYCKIKGDGRSFAVVPGDIVTVSHDVTGWSDLQFLVIEAQDDSSNSAADTRTFVLQIFNPNIYSDSDQTPLQTSVRSTLSSELTGPPVVSIVSLTNVQNVLPGGVWMNTIRGRVAFNTSYTRGQRAKVYITRPGASEVLTDIVLTPDGDGFAEFDYTAPEAGTYTIRVVSESNLGVVENSAGVSQAVAVTNLVRTLPVPTNLAAALNINNVVYSWSAPTTNASWITGYEIWNDAATSRLWAGLANENSWAETFTGTAPTSVQRQLRTFDAQGNVSTFVQFPAPISLVAPTPTGYAITFDGSAMVHSWTPGAPTSNSSGYEIATDSAFTSIIWRGTDINYREPVGSAGTFTRYLRAVNYVGRPSASVSAIVTVGAPTVPSAPTVVYTRGSNTVTWSAITNTAYYEVDNGFTVKRVTDLSLVENAVIGQASQTYKVRAINTAGFASAWSATTTVTFPTPAAPSTLTLTYSRGLVNLSWAASASDDVAYYEVLDSLNNVVRKETGLTWQATPVYGATSVTYRVRAVSAVGKVSTTTSQTLTYPTPAAPASLTLTYALGQVTFAWAASTADDIDYYEILNAGDVVIKREYGLSWVTDVVWGTSSATYKVRAVNLVGKTSSSTSATVSFPTPVAPVSLTIAYDKGNLVLTWPASTSPDVAYYEILDVGNAVVRRETGLSWSTAPAYGTLSVTYKVRTVSMAGLTSTTTNTSFTLPVPAAPSAYTLAFDGLRILHRWNAVENQTYEIATATNGTGVIWRGQGAAFDYYGFSTASRSLTYHIRTLDINGVPSTYSSATINVTAPVAPTISVDTSRTTPLSVPVKVATTTMRDQIQWTVIQYRQSGGSWPVSTAEGTSNVMRMRGYHDTVPFDWVAGGTAEVRVAHEDLFGIGNWSNIVSNTFTRFLDSMLDPNSTLARSVLGAVPMMSGGGTITWNIANTLTWTGSIIISPVDTTFQPTGRVTVAATTSATVPSGSALIARQTKGSSAAPTLVVADVGVYTPPALDATYIDYWLGFRRTTDGAFVLYNGVVLTSGNSVAGDTFIPYASILNAMIADATITSAKIQSLQADKLIAKSGDLGIILADKLLSRNYVSYSSTAAHAEPVAYQSGVNVTEQPGGTLKKTSGAAATFDAGAVSTRSVHYGDCSVYATSDHTGTDAWRYFGFTTKSSVTVFTDFEYAIGFTIGSTSAPRIRMFVRGTEQLSGSFGVAMVVGDKAEIEILGTSVRFKVNGVVVHSVTETPKYPLRSGAILAHTNNTMEPLTVTGVLAPTTGSKVRWQNVVGLSYDTNDDFIKTTTQGWGNAGAFGGSELFTGDCALEVQAGGTPAIGFSLSDAAQHYTDFKFGILSDTTVSPYTGSNKVYIVENGSLSGLSAAWTNGTSGPTLTNTDIIRIAVENNKYTLRVNNVLYYTSNLTVSSFHYPDLAVFAFLGYAKNVRFYRATAIPQGMMIDLPNGRGEFSGELMVGGFKAEEIVFRGLGAIHTNLIPRGNDYGVPLMHKVTSFEPVDIDHTLEFYGDSQITELAFKIVAPEAGIDPYANFDSVDRVRIRVFDQFNSLLLTTILPYGAGEMTTARIRHKRKYADWDLQQVTYEFSFKNTYGWSEPRYVGRSIAGLSSTMPAATSRQNAPLELTASARPATGASARAHIHAGWLPAITNPLTQTVNVKRVGSPGYLPAASGLASSTNATNSATTSEIAPGELVDVVIVKGVGGSGNYSNVVRVRLPYVAIAEPTNPAPTGLSVALNSSLQLIGSWTPNSTSTTDVNLIITDETGNTIVETAIGAGATNYTLTTGVVGKRYYWRVQNVYTTGTSDLSNEVMAIVPAVLSSDPSNLSYLRVQTQTNFWTFALSWLLNGNAGAVSLEWKAVAAGNDPTAATFWTSGANTIALASGVTSYSHTMRPAGSYAYRVKAGTSNYSNVIVITASEGTTRDDYEVRY